METLNIKNMVCRRCIQSVNDILRANGLEAVHIQLGEVILPAPPTTAQLEKLRADLEAVGFELLDDQRQKLIEKVKTSLIELIQSEQIPFDFSIVQFLGKNLHRDYSSISKLFSEVEGISIEKYFILQKTEKVKELLAYNEYSLAEIAERLGYNSTAYLSSQFKKTTGLTPSAFKQQHAGRRRALDQVIDHSGKKP